MRITFLAWANKPAVELVSLCGADLQGANLWGSDLRNANLRGANLQYANLQDVNLQRAGLCGVDLRNANLHGANLHGANLHGANLHGANLRGADLQGADLRHANLRGADLHGATLPSPQVILSASWGVLSDNLTADLMEYDASSHPDRTAFDRWATGEVCPYADSKVQRAANFKESKALWGKGKLDTPYNLMIRVLTEATRGV